MLFMSYAGDLRGKILEFRLAAYNQKSTARNQEKQMHVKTGLHLQRVSDGKLSRLNITD
jgi:hypothetical protein